MHSHCQRIYRPQTWEGLPKWPHLLCEVKLNLYWGSWNKNGWPELDGFTPSAAAATAAFTSRSS